MEKEKIKEDLHSFLGIDKLNRTKCLLILNLIVERLVAIENIEKKK